MPEGTGLITPTTLESIMSLAVYRGQAYTTDRNFTKEFEYRQVTAMYRGIKYTTTVKVEVVK